MLLWLNGFRTGCRMRRCYTEYSIVQLTIQYNHGFVDNPRSSPCGGAKDSMQGRRTLSPSHHVHLFLHRLEQFQLVCGRITLSGNFEEIRMYIGRYSMG